MSLQPSSPSFPFPFADEKEYLSYKVGALLYTPAINSTIAPKIKNQSIPYLTSLSICLEDSIQDQSVPQAEKTLLETLHEIAQIANDQRPLIFIRIRSVKHLLHLHTLLGENETAVTGFILPKFDLTNADDYKKVILNINQNREKPLYFMPILESNTIANAHCRISNLTLIKEILDSIKPYILNIRVGGNDLCNLYGLRRSPGQTIYDIGVVRDILVDIINIFAIDYVVSGPVWEYFGDESGDWERGLRRELNMDKINGFIGKTAIHPSQLPIIYNGMAVTEADYNDALKILNWDNQLLGVQSSTNKSRMNEVKCHRNWAKKTVFLAKIYGTKKG